MKRFDIVSSHVEGFLYAVGIGFVVGILLAFLLPACTSSVPGVWVADMATVEAEDGSNVGEEPGGDVPPGFYQRGCQWDAPGGPCGDPRPHRERPSDTVGPDSLYPQLGR